jgi:hypothetical protein
MITWHVDSTGIRLYRGHELLGVIPFARFAILIYDMAQEMRKATT